MTTDYLKLISSVLTPIALISGVGLIALTIQNRYGRVIDRIRSFSREYINQRDEKMREIVKDQIKILLRRGELLRNAMFLLFLTIFFTILSSLSILVSFILDQMLILSLVFFVSGLISLMVGMITILAEIFISYSAVKREANEIINIS